VSTVSNTFEGGTAGSNIAAASSGGASGTAFAIVIYNNALQGSSTGNANITYSSSAAVSGSLGARCLPAAGISYLRLDLSETGPYAYAAYTVKSWPGTPAAIVSMIQLRGAGDELIGTLAVNTAGRIIVQNATGATISSLTSTTVLTSGVEYTMELIARAGTGTGDGTLGWRLYSKTGDLIETLTDTAVNANTVVAARTRFHLGTSGAGWSEFLADNFQARLSSSSTDYLGRYWGTASEVDTPLTLVATKVRDLAPATEDDLSVSLSVTKSLPINTSAEADVALGVIRNLSTLRLWPSTNGPSVVTADTDNYSLGVEFYVTDDAEATAVYLWRPATSPETTFTVAIYQITGPTSGTLLGSVAGNVAPANANGWHRVELSSPIALTAMQAYRAVVFSTTDNFYSATGAYWSTGPGSAGLSNGILNAPNPTNAANGAQGSFTAGSSLTFPQSGFNATNYWVDVEIDTGGQARTLGIASETDEPIALVRRKDTSFALVSETDIAEPISNIATISQNVPIILETDTAIAFSARKDKGYIQAEETDTSQPIVRIGTISQSLVVATETDAALSFTSNKDKGYVRAAEVDSLPVAFTSAKSRDIGTNSEADVALPIIGTISRTLTVIAETDEVLTIASSKSRGITLTGENDMAMSLANINTISASLILANELDEARLLSLTKIQSYVHAESVEVSTSLSRNKALGFTRADEVDSVIVGEFGRFKDRGYLFATETDIARPLLGSIPGVLAPGTETDEALPITGELNRATWQIYTVVEANNDLIVKVKEAP
jgi:hypothetical protein